jgi:hypothetical protein
MSLTLIYHFQTSHNKDAEFTPASYCVKYFFSEEGFLDPEMLKEMSKAVPEADHHRLTFLNLDDLKTFAIRVAQELGEREIRLLSVQDYNIGLDGSKDMKSYQSIFSKYGDLILNEGISGKKGFFGKLFS